MQKDELYCCIYTGRTHNTILFHHEGGVDIGDVDAKATKMFIDIDSKPTTEDLKSQLLSHLNQTKQQ